MTALALGWMERRPLYGVAAIVLLALVLRVGVVVLTPDYAPVYDAKDYDRHAISIAHGGEFPESLLAADGGPTAFRPPLFPYLLGGVYAVFGDSVAAGRVAEALLGALTALLLFLIGDLGWGRRVGLLAAALAAVFPPLLLLNRSLGSEPLFLVLELLAVWAVLLHRRGGQARWAALAGLACGLAILTRSNGLLLLPAVALALWWPIRHQGRRALGAAGVSVLVAAVAVIPWTIRNAVVFDRFVPVTTQAGFAAAGTYNDDARTFPGHPGTWLLPGATERYAALHRDRRLDEAELESKLRAAARGYMVDHPRYVVEASALNTLRTFELSPLAPVSFRSDLGQRGIGRDARQVIRFSFYAAFLLALGGALVLARRPRGRRGPAFLWLVPPLMLAAVVPFGGWGRYRSPLDPFVVLLAAIGLAALLARRAGPRMRSSPEGEAFTASAKIE